MPLFDEIKKKVSDSTHSAVKATKELAETARLNSQIADEQRKIGSLYAQIGKLYFDKYGTDSEAPFGELCAGIAEANEQIAKLQLSIQLVKGIKRCASCGADVPLAAVFCGKCGSAVAAPSIPADDPVVSEVRLCSKCGEKLEEGAMFCASCGQKQE